MKTIEQRREATQFRNMLLDMGFCQVQLSVYARYAPRAGGNRLAVMTIKGNLPAGGVVRILHITDHQWAIAERFSHAKALPDPETPEQLTIF